MDILELGGKKMQKQTVDRTNHLGNQFTFNVIAGGLPVSFVFLYSNLAIKY